MLAPFGLLAFAVFPALAASLIAAATHSAMEFVTHQGYFAFTQWVFALFCASQAPELVGGDQQYRVLPLYFSRALRREDYVIAKLIALVVALTIFGITPQIVLFLGRSFVNENPMSVIRADLHLLWPIFASAVLIALLFSSLSLLIASVTRRRLLATAAIIGVLMLTGAVAGIFVRVTGGSLRYSVIVSPLLIGEGLSMWLFKAAVHPRSALGRADLPGYLYAASAVLIATASSLLIYWRYRRLQT
jgi:ABC-2 type transport system permease protein